MGLFSGLKKAFKTVTKSKVGQALLVAGTAYVAGGALGMWETPFEGLGDMFKAGGEGAAESSASLLGGAESVSAAQAPATSELLDAKNSTSDFMKMAALDPQYRETMTDAPVFDMPAGSESQMERLPLINSDGGAMDMGVGTSEVHRNFVNGHAQAGGGMISNSLQKVLDFYKGDVARAALTSQVGGLINGASTPTPEQVAQAQFDARRRYDLQRQADIAPNMNVGSIKLVPTGLIR
jgi:hypothetical protein